MGGDTVFRRPCVGVCACHCGHYVGVGKVVACEYQPMVHHVALFPAAALDRIAGAVYGGGDSSSVLSADGEAEERYRTAAKPAGQQAICVTR